MQYTVLSTRSLNIDPKKARGRRVAGTAKTVKNRRQIKHFLKNYVVGHCKQSLKVVRNAGTIKRIVVFDLNGDLVGFFGPESNEIGYDRYVFTGLLKELFDEIKK